MGGASSQKLSPGGDAYPLRGAAFIVNLRSAFYPQCCLFIKTEKISADIIAWDHWRHRDVAL
jgi:hypothetical protein